MEQAVDALGDAPRRVFLALGRKELAPFAAAPQHLYLVRSVDPVDPPLAVPQAIYMTARGPFGEAEDRALLERHRIDAILAKNSGGEATYGKIAAARGLASSGDHAGAPGTAGSRDRRDGSRTCSPGSIMPSPWRPHAACRPAALALRARSPASQPSRR